MGKSLERKHWGYKRKVLIMKKLLILLVAAFALSLVAESAMAQGLFRERRSTQDWVVNPAPGQPGGAVAPVIAPNFGGSSFTSEDKIAVYRRTFCGTYRQIGWIFADRLCSIPGDDYILVRRCFRTYYWVRICEGEPVGH